MSSVLLLVPEVRIGFHSAPLRPFPAYFYAGVGVTGPSPQSLDSESMVLDNCDVTSPHVISKQLNIPVTSLSSYTDLEHIPAFTDVLTMAPTSKNQLQRKLTKG